VLQSGASRAAGRHERHTRLPQPRFAWAAVVLLVFALGLAAISQGAPTTSEAAIWLDGATVERAKAMALDAALIKGWRLADSGRDYAIFETPLDQPASDGPPGANAQETTLLRIEARFNDLDRGVEARLRAEEIWRAGTARAWKADLTDSYRGHLERALQSLRDQWQQFTATRSGNASGSSRLMAAQPTSQERQTSRSRQDGQAQGRRPARWGSDPGDRASATSGSSNEMKVSSRVGTWAFEAERIARERGCTLTDRGTVLIDDSSDTEIHRVDCADGHRMRVACNRSRCWGAR